MGWFCADSKLSRKAAELLKRLAETGCSEDAYVAGALNEIASNDKESAKDGFLADCADNIAEAAQSIAQQLRESKTKD